jgi:hypothetical protein
MISPSRRRARIGSGSRPRRGIGDNLMALRIMRETSLESINQISRMAEHARA